MSRRFARTRRCAWLLQTVPLVGLLGCGNSDSSYEGTYDGEATIMAATQTVKLTGAVWVAQDARQDTLVINLRLPLPTPDAAPPSTACAIPARTAFNGDLELRSYNCPSVLIAGSCAMTIQLLSGAGRLSGSALTLTGTGTLLARGCGQNGKDVRNPLSLYAPVTKR